MDRILTTHVGSLVRPDDLVSAMRAGLTGPEFDALLARSVADVVRQQADVGIDVVSDGEFGKTISWSRYILERLPLANSIEDFEALLPWNCPPTNAS